MPIDKTPSPEQGDGSQQPKDSKPINTLDDGSSSSKEPRKVEVKDSIGVVVGDFARVVINKIDENVFQRIGMEMRFGFALLSLFIVLVLVGVSYIIYQLRPVQPNMKIDLGCELCIAVTGFSEVGDVEDGVGAEFAATLSNRLLENLAELQTDMSIDVWGPMQSGSVTGYSRQELDRSAAELAVKIGADVLVYGTVDASQAAWQVTPLFYISPNYVFEDALEIIGQDQLGSPFSAPGEPRSVRVKRMNDEASPRGRMLAALAVGMTHYVTYEYADSQAIFKIALDDAQRWGDPVAQKLINLLIGNSIMKSMESTRQFRNIEDAEIYFQEALRIDSGYARPYIGLGSLAYLRAQIPALDSQNPADLDQDWLQKSLEYYSQALSLAPDPDLAHVSEKVAMWMGQDYFAYEYANYIATGQPPNFSKAVEEFEKVVRAYQQLPSPILRELASEAHARLGLVHRLEGRNQDSIREYNLALELTEDPEKTSLYSKAVATIQAP